MLYDDFYVYGDQNVPVPAHLNFGKFMLDRLRIKKDEVAIENGQTKEKITYKELTQYAVNVSLFLEKQGVGKGDIVALGSEKRIEFIPITLGIIFTGATYTPYHLNSGRAALMHKLTLSKPTHFICSKLFWVRYRDLLKSFDSTKILLTLEDSPESMCTIGNLVFQDVDVNKFEPAQVQGQIDTAFILYSSGTTGLPKGVQLTHLNSILNSLPDNFSNESFKTAFLCGVWYHNYCTFMTYKFLSAGRKIIYVNDITTALLLKSIEDYQVDIAFIVPSLISLICKETNLSEYKLDSLKIIYSRSAPLYNKIIEKAKRRLPKLENVIQGYGMTEAGELTSESWATNGPKMGSVGMASPGITIKVEDLVTRKTKGPNDVGEICLRGPVFMKGYIGLDSSTYLDKQGFFKTGDLGYYDEDGYFYIVDRLKEIITYDGYQIAPMELEAILLLHPGVLDVGVVGKPVPDYGEEPTAFVVRQPGFDVTEKELFDYLHLEVESYKQLRGGVKFIDEIPRNPTGKILRRILREMLNQEVN